MVSLSIVFSPYHWEEFDWMECCWSSIEVVSIKYYHPQNTFSARQNVFPLLSCFGKKLFPFLLWFTQWFDFLTSNNLTFICEYLKLNLDNLPFCSLHLVKLKYYRRKLLLNHLHMKILHCVLVSLSAFFGTSMSLEDCSGWGEPHNSIQKSRKYWHNIVCFFLLLFRNTSLLVMNLAN